VLSMCKFLFSHFAVSLRLCLAMGALDKKVDDA
jgi:hypothetical protein